MLSIITIEDTSMFPRVHLPNEFFCVGAMDREPSDNPILRAGTRPNPMIRGLLERPQQGKSNNCVLYLRQVMDYGVEDSIELVDGRPHGLNYNGNARVFVEQLNSIRTKSPRRAIAMMSSLAYIFPKSFWDAVLDAGYYVILDELYESGIQHIYPFVMWAVLNGLDTSRVVMLTCRTHCQPSLPPDYPGLNTVDDDLIQVGFNVISVPSFCWALTRNGVSNDFKEYRWSDSPANNNRGLFLNRRLKEHRLLAISYLHKKGMLDKHFDWSMTGDPMDPDSFEHTRLDNNFWLREAGVDSWFGQHEFEQLKQMYPKILDFPNEKMDLHPIIALYKNTDFSLVAESNLGCNHWDIAGINDIPFFSKWYNHMWVYPRQHRVYISVTEKSYRPLSVGHPIVTIGGFRTMHTLRRLGFVTYNETGLFDEAYDEELDDSKRLIKAVDESIRVATEGFNVDRAREIGRHNADWFWNDHALHTNLRRHLVDPLMNLIR